MARYGGVRKGGMLERVNGRRWKQQGCSRTERKAEREREREREARGFVRKGMMYDLSVPRSAVARFSTPSSSRKAVPWPAIPSN